MLPVKTLETKRPRVLQSIPLVAQAAELARSNLASNQTLDRNDSSEAGALPLELAIRQLASDKTLDDRRAGLLVRSLRLLQREREAFAVVRRDDGCGPAFVEEDHEAARRPLDGAVIDGQRDDALIRFAHGVRLSVNGLFEGVAGDPC